MPRFELQTIPNEMHRLRSCFLKLGVSLIGAEQLMAGQVVTNPMDRRAVANLVRLLIEHAGNVGDKRQWRAWDVIKNAPGAWRTVNDTTK